MRNHNQPCCVTIPGHDPNRRRVQPQTGCRPQPRHDPDPGRRPRPHPRVEGPSALADAARFLCRTFRTPAARRRNARVRLPLVRRR